MNKKELKLKLAKTIFSYDYKGNVDIDVLVDTCMNAFCDEVEMELDEITAFETISKTYIKQILNRMRGKE